MSKNVNRGESPIENYECGRAPPTGGYIDKKAANLLPAGARLRSHFGASSTFTECCRVAYRPDGSIAQLVARENVPAR